jgi:serine/threonine protein phosphatase PrpC
MNRIEIVSANAGDARTVLGCNARLVDESAAAVVVARRLSHDHKVQDPAEVARIEQAGGFVFRHRVLGLLAVTRSLGDQVAKPFVCADPFVSTIALDLGALTDCGTEPGPFLIMACDGLWDVLTDDEAVRLVCDYCASRPKLSKDKVVDGSHEDPKNGCQHTVAQYLVDEAIRRGSTDNVTVIVVWF